MDKAEAIVGDHLKSLNLNLIHHPDGKNDPPDFAINGRIGIEVTRLTQHWKDGDRHRGIDERTDSLYRLVEQVFAEFGIPPAGTPTYWVSCSVSNPVPEAKKLRRDLRVALDRWLRSPTPPHEIEIGSLELRFHHGSSPQLFSLGVRSNNDGGGFVIAEMVKSINICIEEKTRKIERVRDRYAEWWIALVDWTALGTALDPGEVQAIRDNATASSCWSKILLFLPSGRVLELQRT